MYFIDAINKFMNKKLHLKSPHLLEGPSKTLSYSSE